MAKCTFTSCDEPEDATLKLQVGAGLVELPICAFHNNETTRRAIEGFSFANSPPDPREVQAQ